MILSDGEIRQLCNPRHIVIDGTDPDASPMIVPFNEEQLQPASYDVRLGNKFRVFQRDQQTNVDLDDPCDITKEVVVDNGDYFTLHPGEFILGHTMEEVWMPDNVVARIEGRSSIGRLGLMIHVTAGYIDPGFNGSITMEMTSLHPLPMKLRPGKTIAQLSFDFMSAPAEKPYNGRYQGDKSVASSRFGRMLPMER